MFCVTCGSENPDFGKFCHECGKPLFRANSGLVPRNPTEKELSIEVLKIDPKPNECHRCGTEMDLTRHDFAIAKVVTVKREWSETIVRAGVSALSIATAPLTGFGAFSWKGPKKTTSFNLFKTELVLCSSCLSWAWKTRNGTELKIDAYRCHPWAGAAGRIGYNKYLSAEEVASLKPIQ